MITTPQTGSGPRVFKEEQGAGVIKGENARLSSFIGAIAVADLVKTTLGPKGMDKMLTSTSPSGGNDVTVTNDGATILKKIPLDNPAAKILVNISMTQDDEVGDGTTSVVVLAGELLREAEKLSMQKMHPQTIIRGWRKAIDVAIKSLKSIAVDNKKSESKFRNDLLNIARTTLSSKIVTGELDFFAHLCVKAVLRLKGSTDLDMLQIVKKPGGSMKDSFLDDGFILDKKFGLGQQNKWIKPKIMVANTPMDTDKIKIWGARVKVHSMNEVAKIEEAEKLKMKRKVENILSHNVNIFINRQLIYDYPEELFREAGIASIEHADFNGVERLARVLGCEIMSVFDKTTKEKIEKENSPELIDMGSEDENENENEETQTESQTQNESTTTTTKPTQQELSNNIESNQLSKNESLTNETKTDENEFEQIGAPKYTHLGTCELVEEMMIGEDTVIKFSGVPRGEACTIVLRGGSTHLLDEMERSIHDALCVLTQTVGESSVVLGGGSSEMHMANAVEEFAAKTSGKEQLAIDGFANALRQIPIILAENAGFDSAEIISNLRSFHKNSKYWMGVDMNNGRAGDMRELGVTESYKSKSQSLISAHEAAEMILRVDDIVKNAPRSRGPPR